MVPLKFTTDLLRCAEDEHEHCGENVAAQEVHPAHSFLMGVLVGGKSRRLEEVWVVFHKRGAGYPTISCKDAVVGIRWPRIVDVLAAGGYGAGNAPKWRNQ